MEALSIAINIAAGWALAAAVIVAAHACTPRRIDDENNTPEAQR